MTFNPEDYGIERAVLKRSRGGKTSTPYIRRSVSNDGKEYIYVRLNGKLTDEFRRVFGQYVGVGFINGNLMFYPEDDADHASAISSKDRQHDHNAQIYIQKAWHERIKAMYGDNFSRVKCNWIRHILGGHTCFELVPDEIVYSKKEQVVA